MSLPTYGSRPALPTEPTSRTARRAAGLGPGTGDNADSGKPLSQSDNGQTEAKNSPKVNKP